MQCATLVCAVSFWWYWISSEVSMQFILDGKMICAILSYDLMYFMRWNAANRFTLHYQQHQHFLLSFKQLPPFPWLTTPLSLRRGAGGEALFAFHYFTFCYQSRHAYNYFISQLGTSCSFDSPGLPNDSAGYPGLAYGLCGTTPSVLCFFWLTRH